MKQSIIYFGNEKLATGISQVRPVIREAIMREGFEIEKIIAGPLDDLGKHKSQLAVLIAYGQIIPEPVLNQFPLGIINVHPSLLPLYRGPAPIEQTILDGATKTGISIMRLTNKMDGGPIYKQKSIQLAGNETKDELAAELQNLGAKLLVDVLLEITNKNLEPRQQPHPSRATYTKKIEKQDGVIDWSKSAQQLEREIRAYSGWPKSHTTLRSIECIITQVDVGNDQGKPGDHKIIDNKLIVYCGHGSLKIDRLQPIGKKEMFTREFLLGYKNRL